MKRPLFIILFSITSWIYAQNDNSVIKKEAKRFMSFRLDIGAFKVPVSGGFNTSYNIQFSKVNRFNFGFDLLNSYYISPNLDLTPSDSQIINYNPEIDESYSYVRAINNNKDRFSAFSLYVSKFFKLTNGIYLDFQVGPSLVLIKQREFEYRYSQGFNGTFSGGGSPPVVTATSRDHSEFAIGVYLRMSTQFKISPRTVIELTPFSNMNSKETVFGIQFGFVFGRGYKITFLNNQ